MSGAAGSTTNKGGLGPSPMSDFLDKPFYRVKMGHIAFTLNVREQKISSSYHDCFEACNILKVTTTLHLTHSLLSREE